MRDVTEQQNAQLLRYFLRSAIILCRSPIASAYVFVARKRKEQLGQQRQNGQDLFILYQFFLPVFIHTNPGCDLFAFSRRGTFPNRAPKVGYSNR